MTAADTELEADLAEADRHAEGLLAAGEAIRDLQLPDRVLGSREMRAAAAGFLAGNTPRAHPEDTAIETALETARTSQCFTGTVLLTAPIMVGWLEIWVSGLTGRCRMVDSKEHLGIRSSSRDSNWAIMVAGRTSQIMIPGCQVRMVQRHALLMDQPNPNIVEVP
jgi:hypothetical protein